MVFSKHIGLYEFSSPRSLPLFGISTARTAFNLLGKVCFLRSSLKTPRSHPALIVAACLMASAGIPSGPRVFAVFARDSDYLNSFVVKGTASALGSSFVRLLLRLCWSSENSYRRILFFSRQGSCTVLCTAIL